MFLVVALLVGSGVAFGKWRHSVAEAEINATSEQRRSVRFQDIHHFFFVRGGKRLPKRATVCGWDARLN
jgi:hypothetical protein